MRRRKSRTKRNARYLAACNRGDVIYYRGMDGELRASGAVEWRGRSGRRAIATLAALLGVFGPLLWGCQAPVSPSELTMRTLRIGDYEAFVDDALAYLRRCDLPPEYVDRTGGLIVTKPTTSGQWFEWWRVDSQGGYQLLENSLHTVQRMVTIRIEPLKAPASQPTGAGAEATSSEAAAPTGDDVGTPLYRVSVRVDKLRYSAPERQVTTASGALAIYSERLPTTEGQQPKGHTVSWIPLGRDPLLESFLLDRLARLRADVAVAE